MTKKHLFTSESVSMGHPDKVADQISDSILDSLLAVDAQARVACETLVTTGLVVLAGEVTVHNQAGIEALNRAEDTVRETIREIGYDDPRTGFDYRSCAVLRAVHGQSADISRGVTASDAREQGAGDQGIMFGFACNETRSLMPLPIYLSHRLVEQQARVRRDGSIPWLRPDAKSQVTVEYIDNRPHRLHTVVISTQHTEEAVEKNTDSFSDAARRQVIEKIIKPVVMAECPQLWNNEIIFHINPTGKFLIGGPQGDSGLTGRKIIVDTYGGRGSHGGGAFSGKDPSKVDRSASYMARYIAKNVVAAGLATACEVQLSYAIGVAEPVSVLVDTENTAVIDEQVLSDLVRKVFPLKPQSIIKHLNLLRPIYRETARHGHFGRELPQFTWELTDKADELARLAGVKTVKKTVPAMV
ncbi:MAG: methionine adenosyltransferase [Planctomycetes bacterium]|jgi:S-adenosylmethionine synthetase|nr:methionine adenosyltransferase [Planctomycetota bacterium]MDA8376226.1 methionine adenosyltransferase [Planctomycetia bacterium]